MTKLRFAANPFGYLTVGRARIALANYRFARRDGGQFLLRFDDSDRAHAQPDHVQPAHAQAIIRDLRWLGIDWDAEFQQSDRLALYAAAAERLKQSGRLYPCFESEEELAAKRTHRLKRGRSAIYDRAMLQLTPAQREAAEAGGKRPHWRFLLSESAATQSDPVMLRADGTPLAIFAGVVDDIDTGIDHVIDSEDQRTTTAIQFDIFAALGAAPPRYEYLPLLPGGDTGNPPRRIDSRSLRSMRNDGIEATALATYLGQSPNAPRSFDTAQLLALNRGVLQDLPFAAVAERLPPDATERFWLAVRRSLDLLNEARHWWDVVAGTIVPPLLEGEQALLCRALACLPPEPWNQNVWATWSKELGSTSDDGAAETLRLAITGEEQGPALHDLLPLIGRARAEQRLRIAAGIA